MDFNDVGDSCVSPVTAGRMREVGVIIEQISTADKKG